MRAVGRTGASGRVIRSGLGLVCLMMLLVLVARPADAADEWDPTVDQIVGVLEEIPVHYAAGDVTAVETSIRKAYYETFQVSGLEDQIKHRLGRDRADAFMQSLLGIRQLAREGATTRDVESAVQAVVVALRADVTELGTTAELSDQWTRVATAIDDSVNGAVAAFEAGDVDAAYTAATAAYLGHYEADGLEKATIAYIGNSRVSAVEAEFRELRSAIRAEKPLDQIRQTAELLVSMVQEDAAQLDRVASGAGGLGWAGFSAAFFILLREGAEALLVVAAVVTYVVRAGRRDQLKWVVAAVTAALVVSIALAILLSSITASAAAGFGQELVEGVAGALAVVVLVYTSGWILSRSEGDAWIRRGLEGSEGRNGTWTLVTVVFLAVVREGAETILFFAPITAAATTAQDHLMIWLGVGAAVVTLAIMFLAVWRFGVRLPIGPFFKAMSALLAILAVTFAGGAVKEFQDATLVSATPVPGVPEISVLGIHPTVETLLAQLVVVAVVVATNLVHRNRSRSRVQATPTDPSLEGTAVEVGGELKGRSQS